MASLSNPPQLLDQKILIIKLQYVGDTMGVIPVVNALKAKAPGLTVDVLIHKEFSELIAYSKAIGKIWNYDREAAKSGLWTALTYHLPLIRNLRREKYDIVIALTQGDRAFFLSRATGAPLRVTFQVDSPLTKLMNAISRPKSQRKHFIEHDIDMLEFFGIENQDIQLMIPIPEDVRSDIKNRLSFKTEPNRPKVAIHPGARKTIRQWKPDRFAQIARQLAQKHQASIILVGGPGEDHLLEEIEQKMGFPAALKSCHLSLLDMAAIFSECLLFIGNDSGPGHIAAAVGCPTLSLFGPNFPQICRPYIATGEVIFKNLDCCGCRQEEHLCVRPKNTCMDLIEVDEVWQKASAMLSRQTV